MLDGSLEISVICAKKTYFPSACATSSTLPSNLSTLKYSIKYIEYSIKHRENHIISRV